MTPGRTWFLAMVLTNDDGTRRTLTSPADVEIAEWSVQRPGLVGGSVPQSVFFGGHTLFLDPSCLSGCFLTTKK